MHILYPLLVLLVAILGIVGYVLNIIDLVGMELVTSTEVILRFVGIIIPPLGAFMGLFI